MCVTIHYESGLQSVNPSTLAIHAHRRQQDSPLGSRYYLYVAKMKHPATKIVLLALGIALLGVLIWRVGFDDVLDNLRVVGWGAGWLLLVALAWGTLGALALWLLIDAERKIPFWKVWQIRVASEGVNTLTMFLNVAGEPIKVALLAPHIGADVATASVILDKTLYFAATLLFMVTGLAIGAFVLSSQPLVLGGSVAVVLLWCVALAWVVRQQSRRGLLAPLVRLCQRLGIDLSAERRAWLERVDTIASNFWSHHRRRAVAVFWVQFASRVVRAFDVLLACWLLGTTLSFFDSYFVASVSVLTNTVFAFIPGTLGVTEGSHGFVFYLLGLATALGLSVAILRRIRTIVYAGLSCLLFFAIDKPAAVNEALQGNAP